MDSLIYGEQGFDKVKEQIWFLYPELYIGELDYFKVVLNGCLLEEIDLVEDQLGDEEIHIPSSTREVTSTNEVVKEIIHP